MRNRLKNLDWRFIIVVIIILASFQVNAFYMAQEYSFPRKSFKEFPPFIDGWRMVNDHEIGKTSMEVLGVNDYVMRDYVNSQGEVVDLYLGYFNNQKEGKQIHSPRQCLVGSGWRTLKYKCVQLHFGNQEPFQANYQLMAKDNSRKLYVWWYQGRGRAYANEYYNKLYLMWDSILKRRTDGALVRVGMGVGENESLVFKKEKKFIALIINDLKNYIPN
ncbi:MAG: EpsI family protein [Bacteroidales bacterium]|nr:EpsI family protein [Bacteroidales bacterium]